MSIVPLCKLSIVGHGADKDTVLQELQEFGCLQLLPLNEEAAEQIGTTRSAALSALKFLLSCPQRRRQVKWADEFNADEVEHQALELQERIRDLEDERDALVQRIADLEP
jgi:V/A-type H+-transporting ATPase subunit I